MAKKNKKQKMLCLSTNALIKPTCNAGTELNSPSECCALKNIMTMTIDDDDDDDGDHWKCRKNMCKQNESLLLSLTRNKKKSRNISISSYQPAPTNYSIFKMKLNTFGAIFPPKICK